MTKMELMRGATPAQSGPRLSLLQTIRVAYANDLHFG